MIDRRFDRRGALGRRDEVLRLRVFRPAEGSSAAAYGMLGWKGPHSRQDGYRHRAEAEARVADPEAVVTILERLGFTVSLRIERRVEVWRLGDAVLRLETYPAMDVLLEVEGEPSAIERVIAATGLERERVLDAVSRRAWLGAWERAVRRAGERVSAAVDAELEHAARRVRMPRLLRRRRLLSPSEQRAIAARLASGGEGLIAALDALDAAAAQARDASVLDKVAHAEGQGALPTAARARQAAWRRPQARAGG